MTVILNLDKRRGSADLMERRGARELKAALESAGARVIEGIFPSDVEFLGNTAFGECTPIGIEHKSASTGDAFTSLTDGRITGEQLPRMVEHYPAVRYLIIEGNTRRAKDGTLELHKYWPDEGRFDWRPAYSRNGVGWTYREFRNRIESIEEFWSAPNCSGRTRVVETYDAFETAAFIVDRYNYWQKPYDQHSSARQWDRSREVQPPISSPFVRGNRKASLAQLWAADIDGIGQARSVDVARYFKTPIALALGSEEDWRSIELKVGKPGAQKIQHFGKERVKEILKQIHGE